MKALPFTIPKPANRAILYQIDKGSLYNQLHQHEEVQISWIVSGVGTLVAGEAVHSYNSGDILVLGGQQPHVFQSGESSTVMHSVFFSREAFGETFLALEEGKGIEEFYAFAKAGFKTIATPQLIHSFQQISHHQGVQRLKYFIQLVGLLLLSDGKTLSNFLLKRMLSEKEGQRMSAIFDYSLAHYREEISLRKIAEVAAMTPNAFCKYFKKRTNKTYMTFLTDLRIEKVCALLKLQDARAIAEIAQECGFHTLSHFNKTFKNVKGMTPSAFRNQ